MSADSMSLLPTIEFGQENEKIIYFIAGFPDNLTSSWEPLLPVLSKKYHLICMCLPGFDTESKESPYGIDFPEIIVRMRNTILKYGVPYTIIAHDWGAYTALQYERIYNDSNKLILMDVGVGLQKSPIQLLIILFYQFWFAFSYLLSTAINYNLGNYFFLAFTVLRLQALVGPCPYDIVKRNKMEINVKLCYVYFYFWKNMFLFYIYKRYVFPGSKKGFVVFPSTPKCPTLFMYGKKKRAFFHSNDFVNKLNERGDGSKALGIDGYGHWFHYDSPEPVLEEINEFLN
jgi:pimeloyl-ACP methyl ester carboxylesterase